MRLLCLGYGYCAETFVADHGGRFASVSATFRRREQEPILRRAWIEAVPAGETGTLESAARASDVLLVSAAPDETGDPFVARVATALGGQGEGLIVLYLSTVGVYGDQQGGWVSEETPEAPGSERSRRRLEAEQAWIALGAATGARVHILRLAGIYGPGSSQIDSLRAGHARRIVKPGQVFNRIHVADIAGICAALLDYRGTRRVWNVADDAPAPPQEVVAHAAGLLAIAPPPEEPFEGAELSAMSRSFYAENKRIANRALYVDLGYALKYPTYREGLAALV